MPNRRGHSPPRPVLASPGCRACRPSPRPLPSVPDWQQVPAGLRRNPADCAFPMSATSPRASYSLPAGLAPPLERAGSGRRKAVLAIDGSRRVSSARSDQVNGLPQASSGHQDQKAGGEDVAGENDPVDRAEVTAGRDTLPEQQQMILGGSEAGMQQDAEENAARLVVKPGVEEGQHERHRKAEGAVGDPRHGRSVRGPPASWSTGTH